MIDSHSFQCHSLLTYLKKAQLGFRLLQLNLQRQEHYQNVFSHQLQLHKYRREAQNEAQLSMKILED